MKQTNLYFLLVLVGLLLAVQCGINGEFLDRTNSMIGNDVNTGGLIGAVTRTSYWTEKDDNSGDVMGLANSFIEIKIPPINFMYGVINIPPIKIYPYTRIKPLAFGPYSKITSLTFTNSIASPSATVTANGLLAIRRNNVVQFRQCYGTASAPINKMYQVVSGRTFERGLFPHELELIQTKLQREAAVAMRDEILKHDPLAQIAPAQLRESLFLEESNKLRQLYVQIEYDYSEVLQVPRDQLMQAVNAAALSLITDTGILSRIHAVASATYTSSFFVVPNNEYFFVMSILAYDTHFALRMSTFKVTGTLPIGAFATSMGTWNLERPGQASSPSIHQLLGVFPALKY